MARHPTNNHISQSLAQTLGQDYEIIDWTPITGGSIHSAWLVKTNCGHSFFIKTNTHEKLKMFVAEAHGLKQLKLQLTSQNPLYIPEVYAVGSDEQYAWFICEYIDLTSHGSQNDAALGQGLALLHQQCASQEQDTNLFGLTSNNFIGDSPQPNQQKSHWGTFFDHQRIRSQLQLAKQNGFYHLFQHEAKQLLTILPLLLADHQPRPSLLHGDLWAGNKGIDVQGRPIIFDPAIYYGDRECDIAMTELFGGFSIEFYAAYEDVYPLEDGYQQRKHLYNLYHILNHANLFGGHYIQQSKSIMRQLIQHN